MCSYLVYFLSKSLICVHVSSPSLVPQVHFALLKQTEEELKEARQDAVRSSAEASMQHGELQRLQEELLKREEESSAALREQLSLRSHMNQLMGQLEVLHIQHQATGSH